MSARMLRRVLQNKSAAESPADTASSELSTSDIDDDKGGGPVGNPFDLLGLQDEDGDGGSDFERDANQQSDAVSASTSASAKPVSSSQSKRKKAKNKKKGKKGVDTADTIDKIVDWVTDGDEKGAVEREGKKQTGVESGEGSHSSAPSQSGKGFNHILMADPKHLSGEDELRRIFGAKVINAVDRQEEAASQRRQAVGGRRDGRRRPLKKTLLVAPRDEWAGWNSGISMECVKQEGPILYFRYQHSKSYQEVQHRFDECVASHDPETIVMLLRSDPYHVDSLLAMSEFHKQFGDHQQAALYLEQCLYALERAWHPYFTPSSGLCRLDFSWGPNKALFIALFRHMQTLEKRGCHRTALEVCKFLLSLDCSDPLGSFFCIDFFAIRAEQYGWLERFAIEYKAPVNIPRLPNFAFSLAVARYHLERGLAKQSKGSVSNPSSGDVRPVKAAIEMLRQALLLYPSTLKKIVHKAPIKEDRSWSEVFSRHPFDQASEDETEVDNLIDIYVDRNALIWRSPELQGWLKDAASSFNKASELHGDPRPGAETEDLSSVRQEVLRSVENEFRHMRLHVPDSADSLPSIPLEEIVLHDGEDDVHQMMEFINRQLLENEGQRAQAFNDQDPERQPPGGENGQHGAGYGDEILRELYRASAQGGSAFLNFLQSLGFVGQNTLEDFVDDPPVLLDEDDDGYQSAYEEQPSPQNDNEHNS